MDERTSPYTICTVIDLTYSIELAFVFYVKSRMHSRWTFDVSLMSVRCLYYEARAGPDAGACLEARAESAEAPTSTSLPSTTTMHPTLRLANAHRPLIRFLGRRQWPSSTPAPLHVLCYSTDYDLPRQLPPTSHARVPNAM